MSLKCPQCGAEWEDHEHPADSIMLCANCQENACDSAVHCAEMVSEKEDRQRFRELFDRRTGRRVDTRAITASGIAFLVFGGLCLLAFIFDMIKSFNFISGGIIGDGFFAWMPVTILDFGLYCMACSFLAAAGIFEQKMYALIAGIVFLWALIITAAVYKDPVTELLGLSISVICYFAITPLLRLKQLAKERKEQQGRKRT